MPLRNLQPRYNIAPTQEVIHLTAGDEGLVLRDARWGLVPHFAEKIGKPMINARSETAATNGAFRTSFKWKRCIIPADGFYEWTQSEDGGRDPHYIYLPGGELFAFAGLWAWNERLQILSSTILTADADPAIAHIHHRMPLILPKSSWQTWLDVDGVEVSAAQALLADNRGSELVSHRVARAVNSYKSDGPELIEPIR